MVSPVTVPPLVAKAPIFAGVIPRLLLALAAVVAPVPPFAIGRVPVTPGVTLAVPSNVAVEVDPRLVRIVLPVASFVAEAAVPPEGRAPMFAAVIPRLVRALAAVVAPVPP